MADETTTADTTDQTTTTADATDTTTTAADTTTSTTTQDTTTQTTDDAKDWRAEWAGEDTEVSKFLGRFASPAAAIKAFKQQHGDIRSGKYIKPVDENSTDEEKAAWAKFIGVPDKPEAYLEKLPDGLVIGDDDKPAIDSFAKAMHTAGAPKPVVEAAIQAYYDIVDQQMGEQEAANNAARSATEDDLRAEWGNDYRRNVNALKGFIGSLPEGVGDALAEAVGSDGVQVMNNPAVIRWLTGLMFEKDPLQTIVPSTGGDRMASVEEEIASIEKEMRTNRAAYNKNTRMQERYRELITAREKLKA